MKTQLRIAALALLVCSTIPAMATAFSTSKSGIKTVATVNWSQLGPAGTLVPNFSWAYATDGMGLSISFQGPSPSGKAISTKGISGVFPIPEGEERLQAVDDQANWFGNLPGEATALWTNSPGQGPLVLQFDHGIAGVGAQIQTDFFGSFTVQMDAYNDGTLLGSFQESGFSNDNGDDSAIFLGVTDDSADITMIAYSIVNCTNDCGDFAISDLTIGTPASTPEPGTLLLLGSGVLGLGKLLRRRLLG
jgi:hypothetical protein